MQGDSFTAAVSGFENTTYQVSDDTGYAIGTNDYLQLQLTRFFRSREKTW
jgi:hypothetical protein